MTTTFKPFGTLIKGTDNLGTRTWPQVPGRTVGLFLVGILLDDHDRGFSGSAGG